MEIVDFLNESNENFIHEGGSAEDQIDDSVMVEAIDKELLNASLPRDLQL